MEIFVQLVLEIVFQFFFECLAEAGLHASRRKSFVNPIVAGFGYLFFGLIVGALSLLVYKYPIILNEAYRIGYLIVVPFIIGLAMSAIGRRRMRKGKEVIRIEKFYYGYLFAFGFAVTRYLWAV